MRETRYCGRTGEIEDRISVSDEGGGSALQCPDCGHIDSVLWLREEARRLVLEEAANRRCSRGLPAA